MLDRMRRKNWSGRPGSGGRKVTAAATVAAEVGPRASVLVLGFGKNISSRVESSADNMMK